MAALTATLSAAIVVLSPILPNSAGHSRVVPTSARLLASDTIRVEVKLWSGPSSIKFCERGRISTSYVGASRSIVPQPLRLFFTLQLMSYTVMYFQTCQEFVHHLVDRIEMHRDFGLGSPPKVTGDV